MSRASRFRSPPACPIPSCLVAARAAPPGLPRYTPLIPSTGRDRRPCGGTHVRATGKSGRVVVTKIEKKSRQNRRVAVAFAD